MNAQRQYTTKLDKRTGQVICGQPQYQNQKRRTGTVALCWVICAFIVLVIVAAAIFSAEAEEDTFDCWVMCAPCSQVNLRMKPNKESRAVGFLELGDSFRTDGKSKNGFIHVLNAGECECWIYCGYVVAEEPEIIMENYVCEAKRRVACRRWVDGPQYKGRAGWLNNGSCVAVYAAAEGWAVTSRGYIRIEWLGADPQ